MVMDLIGSVAVGLYESLSTGALRPLLGGGATGEP